MLCIDIDRGHTQVLVLMGSHEGYLVVTDLAFMMPAAGCPGGSAQNTNMICFH